MPTSITCIDARNAVIRHLDSSARAAMTLAVKIATTAKAVAYSEMVAEILPDLPAGQRAAVAEMVLQAMDARLGRPRMVRPVRKGRAA